MLAALIIAAVLILANAMVGLLALSAEDSTSSWGVLALFGAPLLALGSIIIAGMLLSPLPGLLPALFLGATILVAMFSAFLAFSALGSGGGAQG